VAAIGFFRSELLSRAGFVHGFTKRTGGASEGEFASLNLAHDVGDDPSRVRLNLEALRACLGLDVPLLRVRQVHGAVAVDAADLLATNDEHLEKSPFGKGGWGDFPSVDADAIVSSGTSAVLAVQTADCAAVLLADPESRAVAAVHVGWRGAARGVLRSAVRELRNRGSDPVRLLAAVGPCIGRECCEVGEEVARRFPESADPVKGRPGAFLLDLGYAIDVSLIAAGLTSCNIDRIRVCTRCAAEELFSYRGGGGRCGRGLGFIRSEPRQD
jgi:YfiH family protein